MPLGKHTMRYIFYAEYSRIWMKLAEHWRTSSRKTVYRKTSRRFIWRHAKENARAVQRRMSKTFYDSKLRYLLEISQRKKGVDVGYLWKRCIFLTKTTTERMRVRISIQVLNILTRNLQRAYM